MGSNFNNALIELVGSLANLYLVCIILRIVLGWVRADFYNPVSQLAWKITQPVVGPIAHIIPRWRRLDLAAVTALVILTGAYLSLMLWMYDQPQGLLIVMINLPLKILVLTANLYAVVLTFYAILSWFGPGLNNPASNILWSLSEPILRPIRRLIPPIAGIDLSPLFGIIISIVIVRLAGLSILFRAGILG